MAPPIDCTCLPPWTKPWLCCIPWGIERICWPCCMPPAGIRYCVWPLYDCCMGIPPRCWGICWNCILPLRRCVTTSNQAPVGADGASATPTTTEDQIFPPVNANTGIAFWRRPPGRDAPVRADLERGSRDALVDEWIDPLKFLNVNKSLEKQF